MTTTRGALTLEEFLALPAEKPALELVDGEVSQKPRAGVHHSILQITLATRRNEYAGPQRLAFAFIELQSVFDGSCITPDISVYRWDRIPLEPSGEVADDMLTPPDIVIDIASPEQSTNAQICRCIWYVDHHVELALLVDPADISVCAFRSGRMPAILRGNESIDMSGVLPGFELTVKALFESLKLK